MTPSLAQPISFSSCSVKDLHSSSSSSRRQVFACHSRSLLSSSSERARSRSSSTVTPCFSCSNCRIVSVKDAKPGSGDLGCSCQECCSMALPSQNRRYCRHLPLHSMLCLHLLSAVFVGSPLRAINQVIVECPGSDRPCRYRD